MNRRHFMMTASVALVTGALTAGNPASATLAAPSTTAPATQPASRPAAKGTFRPITLTLQPRDADRPPLALRLTVPATERVRGNAATLYLQVSPDLPSNHRVYAELSPEQKRLWNLQDNHDPITWDDAVVRRVPLPQFPAAEVEKLLAEFAGDIALFEQAGFRDRCEWDLPWREQGFATLLPHIQQLRQATLLMHLKGRLLLARGDLPGAVRCVRSQFEAARGLRSEAFLIEVLVAISIESRALELLREVQQQAACPNLYWAMIDLAATPRADFGEAIEMERAALLIEFPELKKAGGEDFTPADLNRMLRKLLRMPIAVGENGAASPQQQLGETLGGAGIAAAMLPAAREYLQARGVANADVAALPPHQVIGRFLVASTNEMYDGLVGLTALPYWQLNPAVHEQMRSRHRERKPGLPANPLTVLMPAIDRVLAQEAAIRRELAAMTTAEALRGHVARTGKLPGKLDDMLVGPMPPPADPVTGKPFDYAIEGATAVLRSPAPEAFWPDRRLEYRIAVPR
jgi:hypothetical protein